MRITARRGAGIGVLVLWLALVRTLGEIYRLHAVRGASFVLADALPYVNGAMMAVVGAGVAVGCYIWHCDRLAVAVVAATILLMLGYKVAVLGW
ncbi:MAG: hypothetical protein KGN76_13410 [Acidobacteriota bacterium]|nr:hypothetical protein [Acidobacteriota bacterium]